MPFKPRQELQHVVVSSAAGGVLAAVAAVAGKVVSVYRIAITAGAAVNVTLQDTGSNALSQAFQFVGTAPLPVVIDTGWSGDPLWQSGLGLGIQLNASGTVQVNADIWYLQTS